MLNHMGTRELKTERLLLRRYRTSDAEDMFKNWVTDPEAARFWGWKPHKSIETTKALLDQWIGEYSKPNCYHWVLEYRETGEAVGYVYLSAIDEGEHSGEIHYLLSRAYWNRGLMSEACRRVLAFAFHQIGFKVIRSHHHVNNPASGRVMEKSGMEYSRTEWQDFENAPWISGDYHFYEIRREQFRGQEKNAAGRHKPRR